MMRFFILFFIFFISSLIANDEKRIFILHSYSQEYGWTKLQHEGFIKALQSSYKGDCEISVEYLDTKRLTFTPEYQSFFLTYLEKKYANMQPDAVYVTDDNALKFFLRFHHELFSETPVFFSGINDLSLMYKLDTHLYTGVYETKEIVPNIELIRQFSPQTRDIWIVGDGSETYHSIESDIRQKLEKYPKHRFHFIVSSRIEEVVQALPNAPKSFILLTTIGVIGDRHGHRLSVNETIRKLMEKQNLIICSMEDAYITKGVVGGYVTSGIRQGESAAQLLVKSLNGAKLRDIKSITQSPNVYMFDRHAVNDARLILSEYIARSAIVLHEDNSFFERHQEGILNGVFILVILFLVLIVILFFIIFQKRDKLQKYQMFLEETSSKMNKSDGNKHSFESCNE